MGKVFSEELTASLAEAEKLRMAGEETLSRTLCRLCAEEAAQYRGEDMLCLFYGEGIYDRIRSVGDAMLCGYIAACAKEAYSVIAAKNPISAPVGAWAKQSQGSNNSHMLRFFRWLNTFGRSVTVKDAGVFKELILAQLEPEKVSYKVAPSLTHCSLVEIVRKLVSGSVTLQSGGDLG